MIKNKKHIKHQKGKVCTDCKEHKPLSNFTKKRDTKDGLCHWCKPCKEKRRDLACKFKCWFLAKKARTLRGVKNNTYSKPKFKEFTIEPTDIPGVKIKVTKTYPSGRKVWVATEYPKECPIFKTKLDWGKNGCNINSPSLDRIDSTKGYVKGNVIIVSMLANCMKANATPEQLKQFSRYHLFGVKSDKK